MNTDPWGQLPTDIAKAENAPVQLPYLRDADVRKRLKRVLAVTDEDLAGVKNLHLLTGRCRWVAALVTSLAKKQPWPGSGVEPMGWEEAKGAQTTKAIILEEAIADLASAESHRLCAKVKNVLRKERQDISAIRVLLQRLHVVDWLFHRQGAGLNQEFSKNELLDLLGLG